MGNVASKLPNTRPPRLAVSQSSSIGVVWKILQNIETLKKTRARCTQATHQSLSPWGTFWRGLSPQWGQESYVAVDFGGPSHPFAASSQVRVGNGSLQICPVGITSRRLITDLERTPYGSPWKRLSSRNDYIHPKLHCARWRDANAGRVATAWKLGGRLYSLNAVE